MRSLVRAIQFLAIASCAISLASATTACGGGGSGGGGCCKMCSTGKACGDSCISRDYECHKGDGCACNSKLTANPPAHAPVVEVFTYLGPTGLRYGDGIVSGTLDVSPASIEIETGRTAAVYWEHIRLGELVPANDTDVVYFNTDLKGSGCAMLAREFVRTLALLKNANGAIASMKDFESMGFPGLDSLQKAEDISDIATNAVLLASFGAGLEAHTGCR